MVVTILAILCFILLGFITAAGYRAVIRGTGGSPPDVEREKCTLCRRPLPRAEMVERQVGDSKLLWFCRECITRLASDIGMKN